MKKSLSYLFILLLTLSVTTCSQEDDPVQEGPKSVVGEGLEGSWTWVASAGSIAGVTITPESSGKTMQIEFTAEEVFNKFVDGKKVYTSPFILQEKESIVQYTTLALFESVGLGFDHQIEQEFKLEEQNKLWLIDPCCDNFTFEFVRSK